MANLYNPEISISPKEFNSKYSTYEKCRSDVWRYTDRLRNPITFENFRHDYQKYPIEFQMRLLLDIYSCSKVRLKAFNALMRKIFKSESKDIKKIRAENIKKQLMERNLIKQDSSGKEYIDVYRGITCISATSDIAVSWTYNVDVAKWFANRFAILHKEDRSCKVLQGKVYIKDIVSIILDRNEDETVTFPHKVFDISDLEGFVANYGD